VLVSPESQAGCGVIFKIWTVRSIVQFSSDDDEDDQLLVKEAFSDNCSCIKLFFVDNGREILDYLNEVISLPGLILLDMNMPKLGDIEALEHIKMTPKLVNIPIIIFSTSSGKAIVHQSYCKGSNSFITKPHSFEM
jgi:CheY-like chemotaxis protein